MPSCDASVVARKSEIGLQSKQWGETEGGAASWRRELKQATGRPRGYLEATRASVSQAASCRAGRADFD